MSEARRRMTSAARREQLLDECARVVDLHGFHAVTIDGIAAACGVTRTVVHQHFGDLDGMLDALVERASSRASLTLAEVDPAMGTRAPRASMATLLDAVDADPATWRMLLTSPQVGPPSLAEHVAAGRAMIREHVMAAFEASPSGMVADPELTARLLQAMGDELVRLRLADPSTYTSERILAEVDRLAAMFTQGDRSRASAT